MFALLLDLDVCLISNSDIHDSRSLESEIFNVLNGHNNSQFIIILLLVDFDLESRILPKMEAQINLGLFLVSSVSGLVQGERRKKSLGCLVFIFLFLLSWLSLGLFTFLWSIFVLSLL
jgi:hypothetical protein